VQPHIGVFAGSFNPFHKGHYNVLQKAEKLFDKVIILSEKTQTKQNVHGQSLKPLPIDNKQSITAY